MSSSTSSIAAPKAFLFDMGDTIIHEDLPDFLGGTRHLLSLAHNPRNTEPQEILRFARELIDCLMAARDKTMVEFSCIAFQRLLYGRFGISFDRSPEEIEREFRSAAFHSKAAPGIDSFLSFAQERGIRCAVLSNAIFTHTTLEHDLRLLGLLDRFEFVMSSVDYCLRKPHPALFAAAAGRLNIEPSEIWFAGDNWECDIAGARNSGMETIWYNPGNRPRPGGRNPSYEVKSWSEFLELLKGIW